MRDNMRTIDVNKLVKLIESIKGNPAGPRNATQLERALGLSHNCISNAKRRGNLNTDDLEKLENYFSTGIEIRELPTGLTLDLPNADSRKVEVDYKTDADITQLLQIATENNELLKELTGLFLGGKDYGAD